MHRKVAAERLQDQLRQHAVRLSPRDLSTQDELLQHMTICVLTAKKKYAAEGYFAKLARCRARDWLRQERIRQRDDLKISAVLMSERLNCAPRRRPSL